MRRVARWPPDEPEEEEEFTVEDIEEMEGELDVGGIADDEDGRAEARPPQPVSMQPSSMGPSFVADGAATHLRITASWGRCHGGQVCPDALE